MGDKKHDLVWESVLSNLIPSQQLWGQVWTHLQHRHEWPRKASKTHLGSNRCKVQITFKQKFPHGIISLSVKRLLSPRTTAGKMDGAPSDSQLLNWKANWSFVVCQGRQQLFVSQLSVFNRFQHLIKCAILQGETLQNSATVVPLR